MSEARWASAKEARIRMYKHWATGRIWLLHAKSLGRGDAVGDNMTVAKQGASYGLLHREHEWQTYLYIFC